MLRLLGFLVLLAVLVAGVGFVRGWFSIDTADGGTSSKSVTLTLDKDKAKDDIAIGGDLLSKSKEAGGDLLDKVSGALGSDKLNGEITKVNLDKLRLKVRPAGAEDTITLSVPAEATVSRNGKPASLAQLKEGDAIEISYSEEDGEKVALKVEATGS